MRILTEIVGGILLLLIFGVGVIRTIRFFEARAEVESAEIESAEDSAEMEAPAQTSSIQPEATHVDDEQPRKPTHPTRRRKPH